MVAAITPRTHLIPYIAQRSARKCEVRAGEQHSFGHSGLGVGLRALIHEGVELRAQVGRPAVVAVALRAMAARALGGAGSAALADLRALLRAEQTSTS